MMVTVTILSIVSLGKYDTYKGSTLELFTCCAT